MFTSFWCFLSENHPPNVTSKTDYYVVYGELLELPLEVSDPEGMPVTVSLGEGSPQGAVVLNNALLWNVTTNKTTHFFFKATDACHASSTLNITITVNVCQCKNNGRCIPRNPRGQGFYSCGCAPGFTGPECDTEIDECQSYPCVRGVKSRHLLMCMMGRRIISLIRSLKVFKLNSVAWWNHIFDYDLCVHFSSTQNSPVEITLQPLFTSVSGRCLPFSGIEYQLFFFLTAKVAAVNDYMLAEKTLNLQMLFLERLSLFTWTQSKT